MFGNALVSIVNNALGDFVEGLDSSQLDFSGIIQGNILLRNLRLKQGVLDSLDLPFKLESSFIGRIELHVPYYNFLGRSISLEVEDVLVIICTKPPTEWIPEEYKKSYIEQKKLALETGEFAMKFGAYEGTAIWQLLITLFRKVSVKVKNVHVRVEDSFSRIESPLAMGISIASVEAGNIPDSEITHYEPAFLIEDGKTLLDSVVMKNVDISGFGLYIEDMKKNKLSRSEDINLMWKKKYENTVLQLLEENMFLSIEKGQGSEEQLKCFRSLIYRRLILDDILQKNEALILEEKKSKLENVTSLLEESIASRVALKRASFASRNADEGQLAGDPLPQVIFNSHTESSEDEGKRSSSFEEKRFSRSKHEISHLLEASAFEDYWEEEEGVEVGVENNKEEGKAQKKKKKMEKDQGRAEEGACNWKPLQIADCCSCDCSRYPKTLRLTSGSLASGWSNAELLQGEEAVMLELLKSALNRFCWTGSWLDMIEWSMDLLNMKVHREEGETEEEEGRENSLKTGHRKLSKEGRNDEEGDVCVDGKQGWGSYEEVADDAAYYSSPLLVEGVLYYDAVDETSRRKVEERKSSRIKNKRKATLSDLADLGKSPEHLKTQVKVFQTFLGIVSCLEHEYVVHPNSWLGQAHVYLSLKPTLPVSDRLVRRCWSSWGQSLYEEHEKGMSIPSVSVFFRIFNAKATATETQAAHALKLFEYLFSFYRTWQAGVLYELEELFPTLEEAEKYISLWPVKLIQELGPETEIFQYCEDFEMKHSVPAINILRHKARRRVLHLWEQHRHNIRAHEPDGILSTVKQYVLSWLPWTASPAAAGAIKIKPEEMAAATTDMLKKIVKRNGMLDKHLFDSGTGSFFAVDLMIDVVIMDMQVILAMQGLSDKEDSSDLLFCVESSCMHANTQMSFDNDQSMSFDVELYSMVASSVASMAGMMPGSLNLEHFGANSGVFPKMRGAKTSSKSFSKSQDSTSAYEEGIRGNSRRRLASTPFGSYSNTGSSSYSSSSSLPVGYRSSSRGKNSGGTSRHHRKMRASRASDPLRFEEENVANSRLESQKTRENRNFLAQEGGTLERSSKSFKSPRKQFRKYASSSSSEHSSDDASILEEALKHRAAVKKAAMPSSRSHRLKSMEYYSPPNIRRGSKGSGEKVVNLNFSAASDESTGSAGRRVGVSDSTLHPRNHTHHDGLPHENGRTRTRHSTHRHLTSSKSHSAHHHLAAPISHSSRQCATTPTRHSIHHPTAPAPHSTHQNRTTHPRHSTLPRFNRTHSPDCTIYPTTPHIHTFPPPDKSSGKSFEGIPNPSNSKPERLMHLVPLYCLVPTTDLSSKITNTHANLRRYEGLTYTSFLKERWEEVARIRQCEPALFGRFGTRFFPVAEKPNIRFFFRQDGQALFYISPQRLISLAGLCMQLMDKISNEDIWTSAYLQTLILLKQGEVLVNTLSTQPIGDYSADLKIEITQPFSLFLPKHGNRLDCEALCMEAQSLDMFSTLATRSKESNQKTQGKSKLFDRYSVRLGSSSIYRVKNIGVKLQSYLFHLGGVTSHLRFSMTSSFPHHSADEQLHSLELSLPLDAADGIADYTAGMGISSRLNLFGLKDYAYGAFSASSSLKKRTFQRNANEAIRSIFDKINLALWKRKGLMREPTKKSEVSQSKIIGGLLARNEDEEGKMAKSADFKVSSRFNPVESSNFDVFGISKAGDVEDGSLSKDLGVMKEFHRSKKLLKKRKHEESLRKEHILGDVVKSGEEEDDEKEQEDSQWSGDSSSIIGSEKKRSFLLHSVSFLYMRLKMFIKGSAEDDIPSFKISSRQADLMFDVCQEDILFIYSIYKECMELKIFFFDSIPSAKFAAGEASSRLPVDEEEVVPNEELLKNFTHDGYFATAVMRSKLFLSEEDALLPPHQPVFRVGVKSSEGVCEDEETSDDELSAGESGSFSNEEDVSVSPTSIGRKSINEDLRKSIDQQWQNTQLALKAAANNIILQKMRLLQFRFYCSIGRVCFRLFRAENRESRTKNSYPDSRHYLKISSHFEESFPSKNRAGPPKLSSFDRSAWPLMKSFSLPHSDVAYDDATYHTHKAIAGRGLDISSPNYIYAYDEDHRFFPLIFFKLKNMRITSDNSSYTKINLGVAVESIELQDETNISPLCMSYLLVGQGEGEGANNLMRGQMRAEIDFEETDSIIDTSELKHQHTGKERRAHTRDFLVLSHCINLIGYENKTCVCLRRFQAVWIWEVYEELYLWILYLYGSLPTVEGIQPFQKLSGSQSSSAFQDDSDDSAYILGRYEGDFGASAEYKEDEDSSSRNCTLSLKKLSQKHQKEGISQTDGEKFRGVPFVANKREEKEEVNLQPSSSLKARFDSLRGVQSSQDSSAIESHQNREKAAENGESVDMMEEKQRKNVDFSDVFMSKKRRRFWIRKEVPILGCTYIES